MAIVRTGNVERALDALNFFLADVRDGLGPYLAIYLLTEQKWDEASIGIVMSVAALAGIIAQTPAGALIDRSTAKRALMVTAAILVTLSSIALPLIHRFELVAATQAIAAAAGAIFAPAVAAVTLGIVGPRAFARRTGRNEAFNHAGNAVAAAIAKACCVPMFSGKALNATLGLPRPRSFFAERGVVHRANAAPANKKAEERYANRQRRRPTSDTGVNALG